MSRTRKRIIATVVGVLATAALAPAASLANTDSGERTATELGQAVGEPTHESNAAANAKFSRTPTELGQRATTSVAPDAPPSGGFAWGDAAIGAGAMMGLIGLGGTLAVVLVNRRRHAIGDSGIPAVSS
jgi:hypothetical protein